MTGSAGMGGAAAAKAVWWECVHVLGSEAVEAVPNRTAGVLPTVPAIDLLVQCLCTRRHIVWVAPIIAHAYCCFSVALDRFLDCVGAVCHWSSDLTNRSEQDAAAPSPSDRAARAK